MEVERDQWGSKIGFILAAAGSAIGLGNIWKFPYLVGENGGAAFIIIYLLSILIIGLPTVIAEVLIGRTAQKNPVGSFRQLSQNSLFWTAVGGIGVFAGFVILSYYNVIAGWCAGYVVESVKGSFAAINDPAMAGEFFSGLSGNPLWTLGFHALFMFMTVGIIYFGVSNGIEKAAKILMPLLLFFMLALVVRGVTLDGAQAGIAYLMKPDFSAINERTILLALGQAFFSLSLGMGALLTYGSYMSKNDNLVNCSLNIVILDTFIALLAGFMFFPALFALGLHPDQGPALIFNILPSMFNAIPAGGFFRIIFFLLLSMAALTSTISLMEVITAFFTEEFNLSRQKATIFLGGVVFLLGVPSALSFGPMRDIHIFGKTFFGVADFFASNILLPLGGIFILVFVGWFWGMKKAIPNLLQGIQGRSNILLNIWKILVKFVAPVLVLIVLLFKIFG
ncbi:MAG: sodium-dependent transporter [Candidatus Marinimicrobia bacterium]|nr:sodium-dependent transporter [Candidatus Neomarinimicrobiota bacterium]